MPTKLLERREGEGEQEAGTAEREDRRPPHGTPHVWVLAVVAGRNPAAVYRLARYETILGRGSEEASIDLDDDEVSKRHCLLRLEGPVCTIQDLGSLNGTRINGRRMRDGMAHRLRHLDEIQVGATRLFVLTGRFKPRQPEVK